MSFASYSTNPGDNNTLGGLSIAEGATSPGAVNNGLRQIMADGKELAVQIADIDFAAYALKANPVFTGQATFSGRGAVLHFNNPANSSGRIFIQAKGAELPTLANGDQVWTY